MEPWLTFWAKDNEAVARALQLSLSDDSSAAVSLLLPQSEHAATDHSGHKRARNRTTSSSTAKIKKRKPRASSKRNTTATTTTYITADPANFREMVQQVTGVQGGPGLGSGQEQQWARSGLLEEFGCYMPTLDTSAFLFEQAADEPGGLLGSGGPVGQTNDFGPFASFPTLESWGAM